MTTRTRRAFLRDLTIAGGVLAAPAIVTRPAWAASEVKELSLHNIHTGERVTAPFFEQGGYVPDGLAAINEVLRDWRTGEIVEMDRDLLHLLHDLRRTMESADSYDVISGYRSPKTNAKLAANSNGVAKRSLHMQAKAIDIALPGRQLSKLRDAAWSLQRGGVGYYPGQFIHVDTGRVRRWG